MVLVLLVTCLLFLHLRATCLLGVSYTFCISYTAAGNSAVHGLGIMPSVSTIVALLPAINQQAPELTTSLPITAQPLPPVITGPALQPHSALPTALPTAHIRQNSQSTSLYLGTGVVPIPSSLVKKIWALDYVEMAHLLPEAWLLDEIDQHSGHCCDKRYKQRRMDVKSIFTWLQSFGTLVSVLAHTVSTRKRSPI